MPAPQKVNVNDKEYASLSKAAEAHGLSSALVIGRLHKGWSMEEALGLTQRLKKHSKKRIYTVAGREKRRRANHQRWMRDAKAQHSVSGKNKFGYQGTELSYLRQKKKHVSIRCLIHKIDFSVTPFDHLRYPSGGCPECESELRSKRIFEQKQEEFSNWFQEYCSHRLEYASNFNGMTVDMDFRCKIHKTIKRAEPTELMVNGYYGCDECASDARREANKLNQKELLAELKPLLPSHISIHEIGFENSTKVTVSCITHGFSTVSVDYLRNSKHKCPDCGRFNIGYASNKFEYLVKKGLKGELALIGLMEVECFGLRGLKVGVTTRTLEERYGAALIQVFYKYSLAEVDAYILENRIKRKFDDYHDTRFLVAGISAGKRWSGDTELYLPEKKHQIRAYMLDFVTGSEQIDYEKELAEFKIPMQPTTKNNS